MQLNCDLGESFGPWKTGMDEVVMPHLHQANIACGFHASDPLTMDCTVSLAVANKVTIGAHPGYPDLVGFGRRSMACSRDEVIAMVTYQVGALAAICHRHNTSLGYVKPHGALYNDMMADEQLCDTIMAAVAGCHGQLSLMLMATADNSRYQKMAKQHGISLQFEFFADRAYTDWGSLVSRREAGAVIHDSQQILERVQHLLATGTVITVSGKALSLQADTICVHGDNNESIHVVRQLRTLIDQQ